MNQPDQEIMNLIEMKGGQPRIDAGEDFLDNVLIRLHQPSKQPLIPGFIRHHSTAFLLILLLAVNGVSIGLGISSYLSEKGSVNSQESEELVYFVDPGQYQVYTHNKE